jgi:glycosyltransferase involved in cell wall biosynthesis
MEQKQYVVISCPIDTYSGYGSRARDFVKATVEAKKDEWDVWVMPQRWGETPWGYIQDHKEEWGWLAAKMLPFGQPLNQKPDVWMQITVPNEFQPIGNYNIGVTAGIETTLCHHEWLLGINRMDLNLVSSEHSKQVFLHTKAKDTKTNQILEVTKPIEVLFEGVDLNTYFEIPDNKLPSVDVVTSLDEIDEKFAFLFVGHWLKGDFGQDRKNVGQTIKVFLETFKNKHNSPALILKTACHNGSIMDHTDVLNRINSIKKTVKAKKLPNIYLLHGELEECEINYLYNHPKVKAMVNFTKGEGFGRPLLEFSVFKKPIIASGWSGHLDFLNKEFVNLVEGKLQPIHQSAVVENILVKESSWFEIDLVVASQKMVDVWNNYKKYEVKAKRQSHYVKSNFSFEKMVETLKEYYDKNVKKTPKLVLPTLPKLTKLK